jgi:ATP-binding cassette subfamily C protein
MNLKPFQRAFFVFRYFFLADPLRSCLMLISMLIAGLLEGIGIAAFLPLLNLIVNGDAANQTVVGRLAENTMQSLGLDPSIGVMLAIIVGMLTLKSLLLVFAAKQIGYTAAQATMALRLEMLRSFMAARWSFFVKQRAGSLASAMTGEAGRSANCYLQICRIIIGLIQIAVYGLLSIAISWQVSAAALVVSVASALLLHRFVVLTGKAGQQQTKLSKSLLSRLIDGLQAMKPIKAMAQEDRVIPMLEADIRQLNETQRRLILSRESLIHLREPVSAAALGIGLYFLLNHWATSLESLFVLVLLFWRMVGRLSGLQSSYQIVVGGLPAFWFIRSILSGAETAKEAGHGGKSPRLTTAIRALDVCFSYGRNLVLDKVCMTISVGQFVAVVGSSGVGKTTLADLLIGLLRPHSGEVWVDEDPLEQVDLKQWRRMIGYVPQETVLFNDTILINLTLGDPTVSQAQAEKALRRAGAWDFVAALPGGMDSVVGERGAKLSGGQRQRLAIARALVRDPALLILDEATTALDPKVEAEICATLRQMTGSLTILAISHQPAIVEAADLVYRLEAQTLTIVKQPQAAGATKLALS